MRHTEHQISDEHLNAFIDDQLDASEKDQLFDELYKDIDLGHRLCELRNTNELIRFAYSNPPHRMRNERKRRHANYTSRGIAASLLLVAGFLGGKVYDTQYGAGSDQLANNIYYSDEQLAELDQNIILHLDSSTPDKLLETLQKAELILDQYQQNELQRTVEIIVNNDGLNLLRTGSTPHADKIQALMDKFHNISFLACARAIKRMQYKGVDVELLPNTSVASSALDQIIMRLDQGWTYIKI